MTPATVEAGEAFSLRKPPFSFKRLLVGGPKATWQAPQERLSRPLALAVFSSDALSSVAYATEEILRVLALAGAAAFSLALPVSFAIGIVLVILTVSYRQTIFAYPSGGGAYIVARQNLGVRAGLVAAAALLIDYVLTVAVSIAAGVAAVTSAFPAVSDHRLALSTGAVAVLVVVNLRGIRESGRIFAVPTYSFIGLLLILILAGGWQWMLHGSQPPTEPVRQLAGGHAIGLWLVLRAFAAGCTALTGIEAISNGIPAFRPPESQNAASTMAWMSGILLLLFTGITALSHVYPVAPSGSETVVSQLARAVFGTGTLYYGLQFATALILFVASNTSFADFPRLASLLARDGFLPRQLTTRGDRLVFSNGILLLGVFACTVLLLFNADTHKIIPLYAVGVFTSFLLSQAGMVKRWAKLRGNGWKGHLLINLAGVVSTGVVLFIVAGTKFAEGAWVVVAAIPLLVGGLLFPIRRHYQSVARQLRLLPAAPVARAAASNTAVLLVGGIHRGLEPALQYALSICRAPEAIHVALDQESADALAMRWRDYAPKVSLTILPSPYRSLIVPLRERIDRILESNPGGLVTLILPDLRPARWWHFFLHNQTAFRIEAAFLWNPRVVVVRIPYYLNR